MDHCKSFKHIFDDLFIKTNLSDVAAKKESHTILSNALAVSQTHTSSLGFVLNGVIQLIRLQNFLMKLQETDFSWVTINKEFFDELEDLFGRHLESRHVHLSGQSLVELGQREHELANETAKGVNASRVHFVVSDVKDGHRHGVVSLLGAWNCSKHKHFLKFSNTLLLLQAHSPLSSSIFGSSSFLFFTSFLIFEVFTSLHLRLDSFLMVQRTSDKTNLDAIFD